MRPLNVPHLGRSVKLGGRKRPAHRARVRLGDYLRTFKLPTIPSSYDYSPAAASVLANIYDNDRLGDCVIAAGYHVVGVETGNAGDLYTAPDPVIIADYGGIGGYNPADPSTDQGCDEQTAFQYWMSKGFGNGTKLAGFAGIDAQNVQQIQAACYLFGGSLFFGIELPDGWISPFPSGAGFTWDVAGAPDANNGHAIMGCGYDTSGVKIATWGLLGRITYAAIAEYCAAQAGGELYVLFTPDQLAKGASVAPNGVAWSDLQADLAALGGSPSPAPGPFPGGVTLGQAQAWAAQGLAENWSQGK